jgi:uncharacterized OB-fold protein
MHTTTWSEPFWSALERGELSVPYCQNCSKPHFPPRVFCPHCWSDDLAFKTVSGLGSVYSFTVVRANPPVEFESQLPFVIGIVDLDEGVRLMTNVLGDPEAVKIGSRVTIEPTRRGHVILPLFRLVET